MTVKGSCKIVIIPADVDEPIQERKISYTEETEVGCVQNLAKVRPSSTAETFQASKYNPSTLVEPSQ